MTSSKKSAKGKKSNIIGRDHDTIELVDDTRNKGNLEITKQDKQAMQMAEIER